MSGTEATSTSQPSLLSMNLQLLETGKWSDLMIKCKHKTWKVHRSIVCLQSKPLAAMLEGDFIEAKSGVINLEANDPLTVERMIRYLYSNDYSDMEALCEIDIGKERIKPDPEMPEVPLFSRPSTMGPSPFRAGAPLPEFQNSSSGIQIPVFTKTHSSPYAGKRLLINTKVYLIADQYDIPALKKLAVKKYRDMLNREGSSSLSFTDSIRLMYEELPESDRLLKYAAINYSATEIRWLIHRTEFVDLLKTCGEFCCDVLKAKMETARLFDIGPSGAISAPRCPRALECGKGDQYTRSLSNADKRKYSPLPVHWICDNCKHIF